MASSIGQNKVIQVSTREARVRRSKHAAATAQHQHIRSLLLHCPCQIVGFVVAVIAVAFTTTLSGTASEAFDVTGGEPYKEGRCLCCYTLL